MPREYHLLNQPVAPRKVLLFEFQALENLIFFVERFFSLCRKLKIKSDLYKLHSKYIILLRINPKHARTVLKLSTLADRTSCAALDIAVIEEYAKLIHAENAVDKLGLAFNDSF